MTLNIAPLWKFFNPPKVAVSLWLRARCTGGTGVRLASAKDSRSLKKTKWWLGWCHARHDSKVAHLLNWKAKIEYNKTLRLLQPWCEWALPIHRYRLRARKGNYRVYLIHFSCVGCVSILFLARVARLNITPANLIQFQNTRQKKVVVTPDSTPLHRDEGPSVKRPLRPTSDANSSCVTGTAVSCPCGTISLKSSSQAGIPYSCGVVMW